MARSFFGRRGVAVAFLALVACPLAWAQATRTWVSGVGDDVNPCSRTAPCKTFAGAISKTAAGGEINCLDPGGFGAVTITKAITIDCRGTFGSILHALTNGIIVNAGVNDVVRIKHLSIHGAGTGLNGIRFLAGKTLHVEGLEIMGGTTHGIDVAKTTNGNLRVEDTTIMDYGSNCINIVTTTGTTIEVEIDRTRLWGCSSGLRAGNGTKGTIRDSHASENPTNGIALDSTGGGVDLNVESCALNNNGIGLNVKTGGATARLNGSSVNNNNTGIAMAGGGNICSSGNNRFGGNGANGIPNNPAGCLVLQ